MKRILLAFAALAAFEAAAITATKEYVDRRDTEIRTNTYTKAETDARIAELAPRTSLAPATNYTDEVTGVLSNALVTGAMQVWNAWCSQESQHANYADISGALSDGTSQRSGAQIFAQLDAASHITTNDVCNIVTNEVGVGDWHISGGAYITSGLAPDGEDHYNVPATLSEISCYTNAADIPPSVSNMIHEITGDPPEDWLPVYAAELSVDSGEIGGTAGEIIRSTVVSSGRSEGEFSRNTISRLYFENDAGDMKIDVVRESRNALGLARLTDLPPLTNGLISAETATNIANSATNFLTRAEAISGYTLWRYSDGIDRGQPYFNYNYNEWTLLYDGITYVEETGTKLDDATDISQWVNYETGVAVSWSTTRHHITPTALSQLTNDTGYVTSAITNSLASTNYVDNALTTRPTKAQMDEGWWSEWTISVEDEGVTPAVRIVWKENDPDYGTGWYPVEDGGERIGNSKGDLDSDEITWICGDEVSGDTITATRHRVAAPVPTRISDLTNDVGYVTASITNGLASTNYAQTAAADAVAPLVIDITNLYHIVSILTNQLSGLDNALHVINTGTNLVQNGGN